MSKLTRDQVLKLAHLSRLKLSDEEIERFSQELSEILTYVEMLDKANTQGLEPTYQVTGLKNVMRDDEVIDYQAKPQNLLAGAPAIEKNQFKVKRVIE
ncbi:Asp-tRNA(Asn)/Glu-tRNA(Gln) amidotransferase subunit GatC [Candidatus Saccharibacteria bacterium]|nr:Asp-tRNA(Asn)/Glu-tRNA(Gln) amidotransferase subunit GatC [Candidatus Saccharibacteria bacterium]MBI2285427.1 Asp-tRNA(Asn)/Glu-tRNA(Gln) amidotransferase subunit GatC [Candidatus Saccharibacteria bacterium]